MHSLFWRIFRSFWLAIALILIGTVTVVDVAIQHRSETPWEQRGQLFGEAATAFEEDGAQGLAEWLDGLAPGPLFDRTYIVGPNGRDLLGRPLPRYIIRPLMGRTKTGAPTVRSGAISPIGGALVLLSPDGSTYHVVVGPLHEHPPLFGELELPGVAAATLAIALVVSTLVCFFLTRHVVGPIDRLREATRKLAAGDLTVRMRPGAAGSQDDLARLAADFDTMAERLQSLLEAKQQLLRDVSHELRSPLTRLQLALSLARREQGGNIERHLERIANEADRLEHLIARTLKLVRLERPANGVDAAPVDIGQLLKSIADDVAIEADARDCRLTLTADSGLEVRGDAEFLRSAFENVIRNAVRYGASGKEVAVSARRCPVSDGKEIEVTVRDRGPGVPAKDLELIFEPFYRVDAARDRAGGGDGLGLAIAARAIERHGGTIIARLAAGGGLEVAMRLPGAGHEPAPASTAAAEVA